MKEAGKTLMRARVREYIHLLLSVPLTRMINEGEDLMLSEFTWQGDPPEKLLAERFQITSGFHPGQRSIIESLVEGKRVLAIQRTGWGKSLCYQMASLYCPYLTIIFSPLKALMRDQCQRCNTIYAIPSAIVSSDFSEEENQATLGRAVAGELKLLFIAPERLDNMLWQKYVLQMSISMIVIDEAHCISTWGHDFRPHYRRLVRLLDAIPENTPVLGLTATANKRVEEDILQQMGKNVQVVRGTMQRPNLHLNVLHVSGDAEKLSYLAEALPGYPGTGIIYVATKRDAEMVAAFLSQQGLAVDYYHAGRDDEMRQSIEQKLMMNQYKVVCSTNALGMGIDKSDVRFIVHYHVPASPIHYYQEKGRAGRDGDGARCILLYDPDDSIIQKHFISNAKPAASHYETVLSVLKTNPQGLREVDIARITGFSQTILRTLLTDLEDQNFVERDRKDRTYTLLSRQGQIDFSDYDIVREQKLRELSDIQNYASQEECYMGYLTAYLGDPPGYSCGTCGHCHTTNFPLIASSQRMQEAVAHFLGEDWLPRIEKRGTAKIPIHEAGWSLSYHGTTHIGRLVRASKYEGAGAFAVQLVMSAADVIRTRYPIDTIDVIVSVPPTKSGSLVEDFARRVASVLNIEYLPVMTKIRTTQEQKELKNRVQKEDNVKGAFHVQIPKAIANRVVLLIDDIYDSGYMLREVSRTLMKAGAGLVYPFTITRTAHSDDQ